MVRALDKAGRGSWTLLWPLLWDLGRSPLLSGHQRSKEFWDLVHKYTMELKGCLPKWHFSPWPGRVPSVNWTLDSQSRTSWFMPCNDFLEGPAGSGLLLLLQQADGALSKIGSTF